MSYPAQPAWRLKLTMISASEGKLSFLPHFSGANSNRSSKAPITHRPPKRNLDWSLLFHLRQAYREGGGRPATVHRLGFWSR